MSWWRSAQLHAGDWVEVRSAAEIASTLDTNAALDQLPFMPEMLPYCGQRFRVFKRAHKTCDTIHKTGNRRMERAVHLEGLRCDGSAHGNCQAGCLLFWKEEWLRPVSATAARSPAGSPPSSGDVTERLQAATRGAEQRAGDEPTYRCQATELSRATRAMRRWDLAQYLEDLSSKNVGLGEFLRVSLIALFNSLQRLRGGGGLPRFHGGRLQGKTPRQFLGLQPGDEVEVRSAEEIAETLDTGNRNRGLFFDHEMIPSCGRRQRVERRVERIIDERSGRMLQLKGDCIVLEGVVCQAHYSPGRLFCPRAISPWWREIWLRRAGGGSGCAPSARD
jgi:hypothetical protein